MSERIDDAAAMNLYADSVSGGAEVAVRPRWLPFPFAILLIGGLHLAVAGVIRLLVIDQDGGLITGLTFVAAGGLFFVTGWLFFRDRTLGYAMALVLLPVLAGAQIWDYARYGSPDMRFPWFKVVVVASAWIVLLRPSVWRFFMSGQQALSGPPS